MQDDVLLLKTCEDVFVIKCANVILNKFHNRIYFCFVLFYFTGGGGIGSTGYRRVPSEGKADSNKIFAPVSIFSTFNNVTKLYSFIMTIQFLGLGPLQIKKLSDRSLWD